MSTTSIRLLLVVALTGAAFPAVAAETCRNLKQLTSIDMTLDDVGRPLVPVTIDGRQKMMLLDTGGAISTLTQQAFEETGRTAVRRNDIVLYDIRGNRMDRSVTLPTLTVGQLRGVSWRFWIHPPEVNLGNTPSGPVAGLLAPDILRQFDIELDFPRKTVKLFSQEHCEGKVLYWTPSALAVIPITVETSGHIVVPVRIDGRRLDAIIDTGAGVTVMNLNVAQRIFGLDEATTNAGPSVHQFKSLELEGITVVNPRIHLIPDRMVAAAPIERGGVTSEAPQGLSDVIIGQNVLGKFRVYIAYRDRLLFVTD